MNKRILFYLISGVLLIITVVFFSKAYQELDRYSQLNNRSNIVANGFQNLSRLITNAAVINPDYYKALNSAQQGDLFFTDKQTILNQLQQLKDTAVDPVNIKIISAVSVLINNEVDWIILSNVPDSVIHHKATAHIQSIASINSLIKRGIARTETLKANQKLSIQSAITALRVWMFVFIVIAFGVFLYIKRMLIGQRTKTKVVEKQFRSTLDNMLEGAQMHDFDWKYIYVNQALVDYSTYKKEELLGCTLMEKYPGIENTDLFAVMDRCMKERTYEHLETEFNFPNGTKAFFELSIQPIKEGIFVLSVDRTEKHRILENLKKSNRLYNFLSGINQSIVHIKDKQELLDEVCTVAVEIGRYKMAWVGLLDEEGKLNIASMNGDADVTETFQKYSGLDFQNHSFYNTAISKSLRTGAYALNNDIEANTGHPVWKKDMLRHDIKAAISLPIKRDGIVIGIFGLKASKKDFFDADEIILLIEAASDISFALESFEKFEHYKETQALLEKNERRFRALIERGTDMITLSDLEGKFIYGSPSVSKTLGYAPEQFLGKPAVEFMHPDDIPSLVALRTELLESPGKSGKIQQRLLHTNGGWVWCEGAITNRLQDPDIEAMVVNLSDVTERNEMQKQQEFDSNNLSALINNTTDLMWSINRELQLLTFNEPFSYAIQQFTGNTPKKMDHILSLALSPAQAVNYKNLYQRAFAGEIFTVIEHNSLPIESWTELSLYPIMEGENVIGAACHLHDITDRYKNEYEIRQLNDKLKALNSELSTILNTIPANITLLDGDARIIAINESWKQFADANNLNSESYCVNDNYIEICQQASGADAEEAGEMANGINAVLNGSIDKYALEYPCHSPVEQRWFRVEVRPLADKGLYGAVVMHINITERKQSEIALNELNENLEDRVQERTSDLSKANKSLEAFSSTVSHDLRSPVQAVINFSKIIQKQYGTDIPAPAMELFAFIEESGKRMSEIITDLLKLAKYGEETLKLESVNMRSLIKGVWVNISRTTTHKAVLDIAELPDVNVDVSMMQQAIVNLLSNAIKYSSKKDKPMVKIWCEEDEKNITFYFKDNGAGFDMSQYSRLFGAFQRFHTPSDFDGTGVGLTLVKRIIEKHGGTVGANAKVDEGAVFYFTLPKG